MKKIKSIKWNVEFSYRNSFIFSNISDAAAFINIATRHTEDQDDILNFRLIPYIEYEEEGEQSCCDKEEVIENENVHQG